MLITTSPGQRGLTEAGKKAWHIAYNSALIYDNGFNPIVRFSADAAQIMQEISEVRRRDWASSSRWNQTSEFVGLCGEISTQIYMGMSSQAAMDDFLRGLQKGDRGQDLVVNGLKMDIKSTKGQKHNYKFSKTNKYSHLADGYTFTYVDIQANETFCSLLGWARRADVRPFLRDDGVRYFFRLETIRRAGVLKPMSLLVPKDSANQPIHKL